MTTAERSAGSKRKAAGTLALIGGGEFTEGCRDLDRELLAVASGHAVVVLPTAAAFEQPDRVVERAEQWLASLGAEVRPLRVLGRRDAEDEAAAKTVRDAKFVYLCDGSPLHLRSVLKDSALFEALAAAYRSGAVVAASGAGATVLGDPMVDPRGGAYTVGLGLVSGLAVFPYHGSAAAHLRQRSLDLLRGEAVLAGVDEQTALVRGPEGAWRVVGSGRVTLYRSDGRAETFAAGPVGGLTL